MIEKIHEITEIVRNSKSHHKIIIFCQYSLKMKSKVGDDIKTYRIFQGEISLVEEAG